MSRPESLPYSGKLPNREVDVAVDGVGVFAGEEPLDEVDHARDHRGGHRAHRGILDTERTHSRDERRRVLLGDLRGTAAFFVGAVDDLVVDVGDVLDEADVVPFVLEVAPDHVEREERARVADVDVVVDGGAAHVHRDLALLARNEVFLGASERVEDAHSCPSERVSARWRFPHSDLPGPAFEFDADRHRTRREPLRLPAAVRVPPCRQSACPAGRCAVADSGTSRRRGRADPRGADRSRRRAIRLGSPRGRERRPRWSWAARRLSPPRRRRPCSRDRR